MVCVKPVVPAQFIQQLHPSLIKKALWLECNLCVTTEFQGEFPLQSYQLRVRLLRTPCASLTQDPAPAESGLPKDGAHGAQPGCCLLSRPVQASEPQSSASPPCTLACEACGTPVFSNYAPPTALEVLSQGHPLPSARQLDRWEPKEQQAPFPALDGGEGVKGTLSSGAGGWGCHPARPSGH